MQHLKWKKISIASLFIVFSLLFSGCHEAAMISPSPEMSESYTEDYFITVFRGRLNADMPEYMFELLAYFDKLRNGSYSLEQLTISDFATGKIIQKISLPELALWERTYVSIYDKDSMGFELEDLNFDGYDDIKLFDTSNGNYRNESTMEMDITEEKFVLLIPNEWVQIAEYEADSSEGKALAEIVDWAYTG